VGHVAAIAHASHIGQGLFGQFSSHQSGNSSGITSYGFGGDSWFWVGFPQSSRLGNVEPWRPEFGGTVTAPIPIRWPSMAPCNICTPARRRGNRFDEDSWFIGFGLQYYLGATHAPRRSPATAAALMPIANNGNFLVDSSLAF